MFIAGKQGKGKATTLKAMLMRIKRKPMVRILDDAEVEERCKANTRLLHSLADSAGVDVWVKTNGFISIPGEHESQAK